MYTIEHSFQSILMLKYVLSAPTVFHLSLMHIEASEEIQFMIQQRTLCGPVRLFHIMHLQLSLQMFVHYSYKTSVTRASASSDLFSINITQ